MINDDISANRVAEKATAAAAAAACFLAFIFISIFFFQINNKSAMSLYVMQFNLSYFVFL
jgi:hypothetical protein